MGLLKQWVVKILKKRKKAPPKGPVRFLATVVVFDKMRFPPLLVPVSGAAHAYFTAVSLVVSEVSKQVGAQYVPASGEVMGFYAGQTVSELLHQRPMAEGTVQHNSKMVMVSHRPIMVHVESILAWSDSTEYQEFMRKRPNHPVRK
ncbi:hypothetical protein [Erwinia phage vB_Ea277G]|nr:hypothetical protein [Erwinia phage vB_Ea277G]